MLASGFVDEWADLFLCKPTSSPRTYVWKILDGLELSVGERPSCFVKCFVSTTALFCLSSVGSTVLQPTHSLPSNLYVTIPFADIVDFRLESLEGSSNSLVASFVFDDETVSIWPVVAAFEGLVNGLRHQNPVLSLENLNSYEKGAVADSRDLFSHTLSRISTSAAPRPPNPPALVLATYTIPESPPLRVVVNASSGSKLHLSPVPRPHSASDLLTIGLSSDHAILSLNATTFLFCSLDPVSSKELCSIMFDAESDVPEIVLSLSSTLSVDATVRLWCSREISTIEYLRRINWISSRSSIACVGGSGAIVAAIVPRLRVRESEIADIQAVEDHYMSVSRIGLLLKRGRSDLNRLVRTRSQSVLLSEANSSIGYVHDTVTLLNVVERDEEYVAWINSEEVANSIIPVFVDLFFGVGRAELRTLCRFGHHTSPSDLAREMNVEMEMAQALFRCAGRHPEQLFEVPHPKRMSRSPDEDLGLVVQASSFLATVASQEQLFSATDTLSLSKISSVRDSRNAAIQFERLDFTRASLICEVDDLDIKLRDANDAKCRAENDVTFLHEKVKARATQTYERFLEHSLVRSEGVERDLKWHLMAEQTSRMNLEKTRDRLREKLTRTHATIASLRMDLASNGQKILVGERAQRELSKAQDEVDRLQQVVKEKVSEIHLLRAELHSMNVFLDKQNRRLEDVQIRETQVRYSPTKVISKSHRAFVVGKRAVTPITERESSAVALRQHQATVRHVMRQREKKRKQRVQNMRADPVGLRTKEVFMRAVRASTPTSLVAKSTPSSRPIQQRRNHRRRRPLTPGGACSAYVARSARVNPNRNRRRRPRTAAPRLKRFNMFDQATK